jgi:hypothetical protein
MKIQVFLVIRGRYVPFQIDANTETENNEVYEFSFHVKKFQNGEEKNHQYWYIHILWHPNVPTVPEMS